MSIALASDIVVAGESAYFHPSFTRLGMVPDAGITFHLARRVGSGRALSSLMLADRIDAKTALEWGLAYQVVPNAEVIARANAVAHRLAAGPCAVLAQLRALHASTFDNSLVKQLRAGTQRAGIYTGGERAIAWKACARSSRSVIRISRRTSVCILSRRHDDTFLRPSSARLL